MAPRPAAELLGCAMTASGAAVAVPLAAENEADSEADQLDDFPHGAPFQNTTSMTML
ncbi:MAG: hypothetical protein AAB134_07075 [Pseudomonadota bacterium]